MAAALKNAPATAVPDADTPATTIRFDADVPAELKATGRSWQTRVNDAVKDWLRTHTATH